MRRIDWLVFGRVDYPVGHLAQANVLAGVALEEPSRTAYASWNLNGSFSKDAAAVAAHGQSERAKAMFAKVQQSPRLAQGALVLLANKVLIALP